LRADRRVARRDAVDVGGAGVGDRCALDLEDVLGVALAAVREVEAADVGVVVGDKDLRVHEVVYRALSLRGRALRPEARVRDHGVEGAYLPGRRGLAGPLVLHLVHLGRVVDAREVDDALLADLRQAPEDRPRRDHGRADADALLGRRDRAGHRVHELERAARTEVRTHTRAV